MNFLDLVNKRFSVRRYSDQSIEKEKIDNVIINQRKLIDFVNIE